jgi:uncharacterized protein (TIGR00369 family)
MMDFGRLAQLVGVFEQRIPFNRVLGIELTGLDPREVAVRFDHRPELVGNFARGTLHGGVISAVLDLVGGLAACAAGIAEAGIDDLAEAERWFEGFGTIDLRIDYLRPGAGAWFVAMGRPLRVGRRVAVTRMELTDDVEHLVATGTGTYILPS